MRTPAVAAPNQSVEQELEDVFPASYPQFDSRS
jgi:hypothetical protein